jgi:site-specific DNA recombinase
VAEVGEKIRRGLKGAGGHGPRYLFSGLMKCEACGSSFVMKNKHSYQCSGYVNGKICTNRYAVRRGLLQDRLAKIRSDLLSDTMVRRFEARIRQRLVSRPVDPNAKRRRELEREIDNITDAIAKGLLSPALSRRLQEAEAALAALPAPATVVQVDGVLQRLPEIVQRFRRLVGRLGDAIDPQVGRAELRNLLGPILIEPRDGYLVAKMGLECQPLLGISIRGSGGAILRL